jgi:ribosomal-protein-alanine N-acetyltransferase
VALETPDQIEDVLRIEESSFTNPWTRDMYIAELANRGVSFCFLAKADNGTTVGFCSFWRVLDELHINNLAVTPERRRHGVATALLTHVLREGGRLGAQRATLEVRRSNEAARLLYDRFGFTVAGVRRAYYTKPVEDALVLWREGLDQLLALNRRD